MVSLAGRGAFGAEARHPNVIFFLMDDLGWNDLGYTNVMCHSGSQFYESPNIDQLAKRAVILT